VGNPGQVFLVGAGPGDPGLMTQRAIALLKQADVVLYDYLIPLNCLHYCKPTAYLDCVGKKKGEHSVTQSEINQKMLAYAKDGKTVIRLKGGDPLIFGRGGEEMEFLKAEGIPYQVVPGVSAASAVPAYAGIPLTHRHFSRSVAFVTGTLHDGQSNTSFPFADTLVFFMAVTALETLAKQLSNHPPFTKDTPAALIHRGTTADQKMITGTLETLYAVQQKHGVKAPCLLVVGDVVSMAQSIEWRSALPLSGHRVVLLRTLEQSQELELQLELLGAEVLLSPMIALSPNPDAMKTLTKDTLKTQTDIIFTSINGVRYFFEALQQNAVDHRQLAHLNITAIGERTQSVLKENGILADSIPATFHSDAIADLFPNSLTNCRILIPTTDKADTDLAATLESRGAAVTVLPIYHTKKPDKIWGELRDGDHVFFTSASTVEHACDTQFWTTQSIHAYSIGPKTTETIQALKPNAVVQTAKMARTDDMLTLLLETIKKGKTV